MTCARKSELLTVTVDSPTAHRTPPAKIQNPKSKIQNPSRAFTLIELMMVIGIMALVCAMGLPPFVKALRKEGIRKAVSDVVEGCSHARAQAILQGVPTELVIRAEDGLISVRPMPGRKFEEGGGGVAESAPTPANSGAAFKANLPDDIGVRSLDVNFKDQMEFPEAHVRFFPNGTCDEFTITLTSVKEEEIVTLDVITALAQVKKIK